MLEMTTLDFDSMSQVEALVAATETLATKTIAGSSAGDYDVKQHSIMKEATLGLATLEKGR